MSTSSKGFDFMSRLRALSHLRNSNLWKDPLKLSLSSPETKISILSSLNTLLKSGKECVEEEKEWARYLFQDGSILGLNDRLLSQYVEWIANKRMHALGFEPIYDVPLRNNPLPWTQHWISSKGLQVAPQETEVESYLIGGINQDVKKDTFAGFQL